MNGYFQFENKEDGLYIHIHKASDGGRDFTVEDLMHYLDKTKINDCDLVSVKKAMMQPEDSSLRVGEKCLPSNEFGDYRIASNLLRADAVFYPGFVGASQLSENEIVGDLNNLKIVHGIDTKEINKFLAERNYFVPYVVSVGEAAVDGKDGKIIYQFEADRKPVPKINEDGSVDFHELDSLNHVKAGDVVAQMIPEVPGTDGKDIFGRILTPKRERKAVFKYGRNMHISEDGLSLITDVSGHVTMEGGKVFVTDVYEIPNVGPQTGDIHYEGNVLVTGNVQAGFKVEASGNVEVRGIVEGAVIDAGGDVTLGRGVQGMGKAVIHCGGNLVAKFIESAESITVNGNLDTDSILHSKVEARGMVNVLGKNGLIVGGDVRSASIITAKFIGNEMGTQTTVGVGVAPAEKRQAEVLKKEIVGINENKTKMNQIITALRKKQEVDGSLPPDKAEMLQKSLRNMLALEQEMIEKRKEYSELCDKISEDSNARIRVEKTAYQGVQLIFGETRLFIKAKYDYCQFVKDGADIKSIPM
ncbi:MAG: FapA family protein [Lachnospiraceae bacterium]|nr:FapA family protein [Lachnospiraceae bacterium]